MSVQLSENKHKIQILENFIKSNPVSLVLKRALAVKLVLEGYRYRKIQEILLVSLGFISKWLKAFTLSGLEGLSLGYKGGKSYLSPEEKQQTTQWLIEQKKWDISELETYLIEKYDVAFQSRQSYYHLLKEARISWQKAQQINPRYDEEITKKKILK